jgi:hypothetical protein
MPVALDTVISFKLNASSRNLLVRCRSMSESSESSSGLSVLSAAGLIITGFKLHSEGSLCSSSSMAPGSGGIQSRISPYCSSVSGSPITDPPQTVDLVSPKTVLALLWIDSAARISPRRFLAIRWFSSTTSGESSSSSWRGCDCKVLSTLPIWVLRPLRSWAIDSRDDLLFNKRQIQIY